MNTKDLFSLKGRVALVTGGSRGIGKMIAEGFIAQGAKVYISARKVEACNQTAQELSKGGGTCISIPMNISTLAGVSSLAAAVIAREPKVDILVNNAGAAWGAKFDEFPEEGWDKVLNLNAKTPFFLTQAMAPALRKAASADRPAKVINIASIDGIYLTHHGNLFVRHQQSRPHPADATDGGAAGKGQHLCHRHSAGRLQIRHEQGRSRPRRGSGQTYSVATHRYR